MREITTINEMDYERMTNVVKALDEHSAVTITDKDGNIIYANKKFCDISKYSLREILGKNHRILKSGFHPASFYGDMWDTISQGKVWKGNIKNRAKDGTFYWLKTSIYPIIGNDGTPEQYISIRTDITEQVSLRERLIDAMETIERAKKITNMYENSPDLCRTINEEGIILDCNVVYAKSLGYSKEDVIGKSIFEHVAEKSHSALYDSFEAWKNKGIVQSKEIWFKRKDGSSFPTLVSAADLIDENGKRIGSNTAIRDISDFYNVKKELEEEKIKRLSTIGELSSRIAHDIKNPLAVIKSTVELMQIRDPNTDETTRRCFERLERAIARIQHQVGDVLDFVRSTTLVLKNRTMSEVLNATLDRMIIPDGVKVKLPENDANIICDAEKLEVVFANLITNAIQAMNNEGEINICIIDDDPVLITVNDHGSGISSEILPKIFDPLFTTKQIGTGLGLASCRSIIEQHGGKIWAESEVGKGTTMYMAIPKKVNIQKPLVELIPKGDHR